MEMELARETAAIKSTLSRLSESLPPHEFDKMCDFAFGKSKKDWENVWKHEWVDDGKERDRLIKRPRGPSKKPQSDPRPSSPLPPSSPPPPTSPPKSQDRPPPRATPIPINGVPWDKVQQPTRPRSPVPPDGFRIPQGFVNNFGSTRYRPTSPEPVAGPSRPQQSRRLKRDKRRVEMHQDGTLVVVDPEEDIEAQRREIKEKMRLQAQRKLPVEAEISLWKIVRMNVTDRVQDPPVTRFNAFGNVDEPPPEELTNPFAQDDHISPVYPKRPERGDE